MQSFTSFDHARDILGYFTSFYPDTTSLGAIADSQAEECLINGQLYLYVRF